MAIREHRVKNMLGQRFGHLTVIGRAPDVVKKRTYVRWRCLCDCGNETVQYGVNLRANYRATPMPKHCGCLTGWQTRKHGMSGTKPYVNWYHLVTDRDVEVCKRWRESFSNFWEDMQDGYVSGKILCRKNENKGFSKANCFWS